MKKIDQNFLNDLAEKATKESRKRLNYNFHNDSSDYLQRMLNSWTEDAYVRPHKHESPDKFESWVYVQGRAVVIEFDDEGRITDHAILGEDENKVVEVQPKTWHTVLSLEPHTVVYEVKDGPYSAKTDKIFAPWSPAEDSPEADMYRKKLLKELGFFAFLFHMD